MLPSLKLELDELEQSINKNRKPNRKELVRYGDLLLRSGQIEKAHEVYSGMTKNMPNAPAGFMGLAKVAQRKKDWHLALENWDKAIERRKSQINYSWLNRKAHVLLELEEYEQAKALFKKIADKASDKEWGYVGLAYIAQAVGTQKEALAQWKLVLDKFPDARPVSIQYADVLIDAGKYEEAEALMQIQLKKEPDSKEVLVTLAKIARSARLYDRAHSRWSHLADVYPHSHDFRSEHIHCLLDLLEFERAHKEYQQYLPQFENNVRYKQLLAEIYWTELKVDIAIEVLNKAISEHPEAFGLVVKKVNYHVALYRSTGDRSYIEEAWENLQAFAARGAKHPALEDKQIVLLIYLGKKEEALKKIESAKHSKGRKYSEYRIWAEAYKGNIDKAKELWRQYDAKYHIPQVQRPEPGTLQKVDERSTAVDKDSILIFTAVRNERWRLPWFLDYYRKQGVDRFFFVDNDSDDGTKEYLLEQNDVHVFWTDQPYAESYSAMQWLNGLMSQYGTESWCIYVDVDEALIFPGCEKRGLKQLTNYMADQGHDAMYAFMLDMFEPSLKSIPRGNDYQGFVEDYPYFDNQYYEIESIYCPYRFTGGGVRRTFEMFENQTKTPIVRGASGIKFLMSSHQVTPAKISDISGVLLHFKLAGDFEESFKRELEVNTRSPACKRRHWGYLRAIDNFGDDESFLTEHSVKFESSQQLLELELISSSEEFESSRYD